MTRLSKPISWLRSALKAFEEFPADAQEDCKFALGVAAEGGKAGTAKPLRGLGSGVFEIAIAHRGNAFRVVYAVQMADAVWVLHVFQKKSNRGIKTPKREIDLIADRIKRLKRLLKEPEK